MSHQRLRTADAALHFGSKTKLAKALNVTSSAVFQWGEFVPPLREYEIRQLMLGTTPPRIQAERDAG